MADRGDNVVALDAYRPHIVLGLEGGSAHVISCRVIEAFLAEQIDIEKLCSIVIESADDDIGSESNDWRELVRRIIHEWYTGIMSR